MNVSRRVMLKGTSALIPVVALASLAACAPGAAVTPASIITSAVNMSKALAAMLLQVASQYPTLIPAASVTIIENDATTAVTAATALVAGMPTSSSAPIISQVEGYVNDIMTVLASPPVNGLIPAPFNQVVAAAAFTLPLLEAFVAQYLPGQTGASPKVYAAIAKARAAAPSVTTQAQAASILATWAAK